MIRRSFPTLIALTFAVLTSVRAQPAKSPADCVNPFIGTQDMGHCFPGAAAPFGLVQLSPDTDTLLYTYGNGYNPDIYRYCAGYQYGDSTIVGFSHTHFNGTGHSDLGDVLVMPTVGPIQLNPGTRDRPVSGYRSRFSHSSEVAHPGYYAVTLDRYGIRAELTATERVGIHRYRFPAAKPGNLILDLVAGIYQYDGKVVWASVRVENDSLITGYRQTNGWGRTRFVFFAMAFSRPFSSYGLHNDERSPYRGFWRKWKEDENFPERAGHKIKGSFTFPPAADNLLIVKCALSGVSTEGALKNLAAEAPGWDFDAFSSAVRDRWNAELSRVTIDADNERKVNFYTAMYHAALSPVVFSDVDGSYRGLDQNIHHTQGTNYTIFSLWDTYRALHPLFTILQPGRTADMVNSLLDHFDQSPEHMLPVWSHYANENWCMIGYHSVPVVVDACMKGIPGIDAARAFRAVVTTADHDSYEGVGAYRLLGFVPENVTGSSASKTLEYAYDDWTIAQLAARLGMKNEEKEFLHRAASFRAIFDPSTGFMRAKMQDGSWKVPFDPMSTLDQGYVEGNAWNYSLYVPHDVRGLIGLLGGKQKLSNYLDTLFSMHVPKKYMEESEDVTESGMIGNYVHGNEPSHHLAYLYCYAGQPWKTQQRIHQIVSAMYKAKPDGVCGNDDCGQMSAWYVFACLGFYPVAPGSSQYVIGSPCVREAMVQLGGGKTFRIVAERGSDKNIYIQSATLNGKPLTRCYLTHEEIVAGGEVRFRMSDTPGFGWATAEGSIPFSMTDARENR